MIEIENVRKSFGALEVLKGVSLAVDKGEVVSVIGGSGSGKSTLAQLLLRMYAPSAGSIFQKLDGVGAGRLVDQAGLKGHRLGGAQISPLHANIIVNRGSATARDVRELIALAQRTVEEQTGHRLRPEIGFVGEF